MPGKCLQPVKNTKIFIILVVMTATLYCHIILTVSFTGGSNQTKKEKLKQESLHCCHLFAYRWVRDAAVSAQQRCQMPKNHKNHILYLPYQSPVNLSMVS